MIDLKVCCATNEFIVRGRCHLVFNADSFCEFLNILMLWFLALMDVLFYRFGVKFEIDASNLQLGGLVLSLVRITSLLIWKCGSQITSIWDWKQYWFGNSEDPPCVKIQFCPPYWFHNPQVHFTAHIFPLTLMIFLKWSMQQLKYTDSQ